MFDKKEKKVEENKEEKDIKANKEENKEEKDIKENKEEKKDNKNSSMKSLSGIGNKDDEKNEEKKLKAKIEELEEENKKTKETLMRTLAELDNTRKRAIEENEKTAKYAISKFAEDLIPVMEDFYLAFDNVKTEDLCDDKVAKNFFEGITLTQNELKKVFERNGLVRIFPLNEDFNPDLHNAIMQVEHEGEEGKVVQVMQAGYTIKDRLLRPALVGVSKAKTK